MSASLAPPSATAPPADANLSPRQVLMVAIACGVIVANLYFAQPLIGLIQGDIHLPPAAAGFIVTLTQIGYGLGLLLIVPLGDLLENRRLIITALLSSLLALLALASSQDASSFLAAAFLIGLTCVSAQVLVPYAAQLAPAWPRG
ncbi:MAG: MFS transporter, partial [Aquabacterium sp.]